MIAESIWFTIDADGNHHLPFDAPPYRAIIATHSIARLTGVKATLGNHQITIECDGRTLVYDQVGTTIHGEWVCRLDIGADGSAG